jgi:UDP-glucose 4-epimerase
MSQTVLVTGGAGYIGSTVAAELVGSGRQVVILDDFCKGHREAIPAGCVVVEGAVQDGALLDDLMARHRPQAVLHFAAFIEAGESMRDPGLFFRNNTCGTLSLLEAMVRNQVLRLVFSSTAAVYGTPERIPIVEDATLQPTNAYGESKLLVEKMLDWFGQIHGLRSASLRYFNAAGNTPERGEHHEPESHLIPILLEVALGQREHASIFGTDYPTPDGTCVRDYIHVQDLASAHLLALEALERPGCSPRLIYNLGNGQGFSVREVIHTVRQVTGHPIPVVEGPRRLGDPALLVADSEKIRRELGWEPRFSTLESIVASAWEWRRRHPHGYS